MVGPPGASRQYGFLSGPPRLRATLVVLGCVACIICTTTLAHPFLLSPPQEHGPMPLTGAAASRLECIMPMSMSFLDWYNFRVCLILQKPTVRTACFEKTLPQYCKSNPNLRSVEAFYHLRRADIFRCLDALQCHSSTTTKSLYTPHCLPLYLPGTLLAVVHYTRLHIL